MLKHSKSLLNIEKSLTSKINTIDFDQLDFGRVFTDHMFVCDFKNGKWENPTIRPYQALQIDLEKCSSVITLGA